MVNHESFFWELPAEYYSVPRVSRATLPGATCAARMDDEEELPNFKIKVKAEPVDLTAEPLPDNIFEEDERTSYASAGTPAGAKTMEEAVATAEAARIAEMAERAEAARVRAEQDCAFAMLASGDVGAPAAAASNSCVNGNKKRAYTVEYKSARESWVRPACRACHVRPANALVLPCAHLGCCSICIRKARFCFICGSVVRTKVVIKN